MKKEDLVTLFTVAVGTATLVVGGFWAGPLEAGNETEAIPAKIAKPKFTARGVEVTLARVGEGAAAAGEKPQFELAARNTTDRPAELKVRLLMRATSPASAMSRMVILPATLWTCDQSIALNAGESRTFTLSANASLPEGRLVTVTLMEAGKEAGQMPLVVPQTIALGTPPPAAPIAVLSFAVPGKLPAVAMAKAAPPA